MSYALHEDAVDVLLGYVSTPIKKGKRISPDWELYLNFNFEYKSIKLTEASFANGDISRSLRDLIAIIDSGWMVPRSELVFMDARTGEQLPLELPDQSQAPRMTTTGARIENRPFEDREADVTLASVLSRVIH